MSDDKENIENKRQNCSKYCIFSACITSLICAIVTSYVAEYFNYYRYFIEEVRYYGFTDYSLCSIEYFIFIIFFTILVFTKGSENIKLNDKETLLYIVLYPLWLYIIYFIFKPNRLIYYTPNDILSNFFYSYEIRIFITGCILAIYILILNCISKKIKKYKKGR